MYLKPDINKEYVLTYDYPLLVGEGKVLVPQFTVVHKVHYKTDTGILSFTVKNTGNSFETAYGYMLTENTPLNIEKLKWALYLRDEFFKIDLAKNKAFSEVSQVLGHFETDADDLNTKDLC